MNYCRKCQSDYEKPGTCNCFAEKPLMSATVSSPCQVCGKANCYEAHIVGNVIRFPQADTQWSYTVHDHVREEAARRYRPEGIHVPPLT